MACMFCTMYLFVFVYMYMYSARMVHVRMQYMYMSSGHGPHVYVYVHVQCTMYNVHVLDCAVDRDIHMYSACTEHTHRTGHNLTVVHVYTFIIILIIYLAFNKQ